ncbi:hypothetical protein EGT07_12925 [Herbaspirillum sp. HC18]|nr:hypothetical protein EGT07_12925 [Herbaspirillum sp. HC18]
MAAQTTVKVATQTGAAKDDILAASATNLTEDNTYAKLNVLANDPGSANLYSLVQNTSGYASTAQFPVATSATLASGAKITMNADGTVGYDASSLQGALQSYAAGELFTDTFVYTIRMANGALSTAKVTVTVAGVNDKPTLAAVAPVSILDTAADDTPAAVTGTLAGADVDHGAVLKYSFDDGSLVSTNEYGTLTLNANTGAYSFVADPDKIDSLAEGVNATTTFKVIVTDEHGAASDPVTLSFDLVGANDTASISGSTGGNVAEDGTLQASGMLTVSDRDEGQSAFQSPASVSGTYGDFTFNAATGEWAYALRNGDANVQALNDGKIVSDELVVTSLDGTATATVHVDVTGANDLASIGGTATGLVAEDGTTTANGTLTVQDVDAGEAGFRNPDNLTGVYGTFTFDTASGNWTYTLDNGSAAVQALNGGQHVFDELVITSLDGSASETIRVGIDGANEATVPSGDTTPPVNPVTTFKVNHGQSDINNRVYFEHFDSNDVLSYANNYTYKGASLIDLDGNGTLESTAARFEFSNNGGKVSIVDAILIGYTGLTATQVVAG